MKQFHLYLMTTLMLGMSSFLLEGASYLPSKAKEVDSTPSPSQEAQEKFDLMRRNEIDNTDVLAIPSDDSEIEDEQEINRGEKREVFSLPHSR